MAEVTASNQKVIQNNEGSLLHRDNHGNAYLCGGIETA